MTYKTPIFIEHSTEINCYICGRTPKQIGEIFDSQILKSKIQLKLVKSNEISIMQVGEEKKFIDLSLFKTDENSFEKREMVKAFSLKGEEIAIEEHLVLGDKYFLQNKLHNYDRKPISPEQIVIVKLHYSLCPICSDLFSKTSKAAFDTIHRFDD